MRCGQPWLRPERGDDCSVFSRGRGGQNPALGMDSAVSVGEMSAVCAFFFGLVNLRNIRSGQIKLGTELITGALSP